ncbi:MAG: GIY-YIG nuclease family protein, partial [Microcoleus sp. CAN_BIN18]|nr:GIY-YIG nuclease family protein [Microcoleus sp. CAN_BIN18]
MHNAIARGLLDAIDDAHLTTETPVDEALLTALGLDVAADNDVTQLVNVRSRQEIKAAEEIAQRTSCPDFEQFKPIFDKLQRQLQSGDRQTIKYQDYAAVKEG